MSGIRVLGLRLPFPRIFYGFTSVCKAFADEAIEDLIEQEKHSTNLNNLLELLARSPL